MAMILSFLNFTWLTDESSALNLFSTTITASRFDIPLLYNQIGVTLCLTLSVRIDWGYINRLLYAWL